MMRSLYFTLVIIALTLFACQNEEVISVQVEPLQDVEILKFNSLDDFIGTMLDVYRMNDSERKKWERTQNFKSFGSIADEKYEEISKKSFTKIEQIEEMVQSNSKYLKLEKTINGDIFCLPQLDESKERYLMNDDMMYVVGCDVYKRIDKALVSTNINNYELLKNTQQLSDVINSDNLKLIDEVALKSISKEVKDDDEEAWVGDYKYRLTIWAQTEIYHHVPQNKTYRETEYKIKNYRRSLGVWFQYAARKTYNIELESYDDRSRDYRYIQTNGSNVNESVLKDSDMHFIIDGLSWQFVPYFTTVIGSASNEYGLSVSL